MHTWSMPFFGGTSNLILLHFAYKRKRGLAISVHKSTIYTPTVNEDGAIKSQILGIHCFGEQKLYHMVSTFLHSLSFLQILSQFLQGYARPCHWSSQDVTASLSCIWDCLSLYLIKVAKLLKFFLQLGSDLTSKNGWVSVHQLSESKWRSVRTQMELLF